MALEKRRGREGGWTSNCCVGGAVAVAVAIAAARVELQSKFLKWISVSVLLVRVLFKK
eukprot:SAG11_NODE_151_length_14583_cov_21.306200_11_plen_58_part_00